MNRVEYFIIRSEDSVYGLHEAIILNKIREWIKHNHANNRNFYDGRTWTFNSVKAWGKLIPILTEKQIGRAIHNLISSGVLLATDKYNPNKYDRTRWYSFADESFLFGGKPDGVEKGSSMFPNGEMEDAGNGESSITITKPITKPIYANKKSDVIREAEPHYLNDYIKKEYPDSVGLMPIQMTAQLCDKLMKQYTIEHIKDILEGMAVWWQLHKRKDVYKVFKTFARNKENGFQKK